MRTPSSHVIWLCTRKRITPLALTSSRMCPSIVHAIAQNSPWRVNNSIVRCPSHTWYLVACSKGISIRRRRTDPLATGRNKKAKQSNPIVPKRSPSFNMMKQLKISKKLGISTCGTNLHVLKKKSSKKFKGKMHTLKNLNFSLCPLEMSSVCLL